MVLSTLFFLSFISPFFSFILLRETLNHAQPRFRETFGSNAESPINKKPQFRGFMLRRACAHPKNCANERDGVNMNTKILTSLMVIGLAAAAIGGGYTGAWFTDTEQSTGNIFEAGTIDIAVDGENPWSKTFTNALKDMKPGQVGYTNFEIQNVGTNPVNAYKTVANIETYENGINEPECEAYGGTWGTNGCSVTNGINDIDSKITYDLSVKLYDANGNLKWWQALYNQDKTISQITAPVYLGMIPAGWKMKVIESYHLIDSTGNEYQSDEMTFNIVLTGEQLRGELVLENKDSANDVYMVKSGDAMKGTLTYGVKDDSFKYTFNAEGLAASTPYSLINYGDPWPGNGAGTVGLIGTGTTDAAGKLAISGNTDYNKDLISAKIWLVPSSDYDAGTKSMTAWNPNNYLFETGLMDYYDSVK